ncbi:hypothetical protein LLH06_02605 [Mucilaginibacter daejeonensis]|uniref:hypothetical protein n=1 Tax=Mucilaginibacter daejeonensis TaxID=398049 RepID=UPI001D1780AD|nr:hypothetical protein [Mucilaginibacter daejeonensis]UEG53864.1 hypothetical protein LLH06_02605 [Mucilaginibacter daejeonensis]
MTDLAADHHTPWPFGLKFAFRFFFVFFILFVFFVPNGAVPLLNVFYDSYIQPMHGLVVWLGAHVLHLPQPITTFTNGSGDTTYDYIVLLVCAISALVGATVWSAIRRGPCNYTKLYYWLVVVVRFYVAFTMISYGGVKVIKLQFPYPNLYRLLQPYGNSSPMGLAWTFMGFSEGYNYFTGLAELSCGILLLFRRTTALGALIGFVVSANIMAINYCFDVPVKIVSTLLTIMCLFILSKDAGRFLNLLILNRPAQPANLTPMRFRKKWKNITMATLKYLVIAYVIASDVSNLFYGYNNYGDHASKPPLYGIYEVKSFVRGKDTVAPLITDTTRWRRLVINYKGTARAYLMNDSVRNLNFEVDTAKKLATVYSATDTLHKYKLHYARIPKDTLLLKGFYKGDTVNVKLHRFDEKKFRLTSRGFHWVNEYPYNR